MNLNLVALKRLRYPRGPDGKEYGVGDAFTVLSERDAKALTLVRAAKEASATPPVRGKAMKADAPAAAPPMPAPALFEDAEARPGRATYKRRDMIAED